MSKKKYSKSMLDVWLSLNELCVSVVSEQQTNTDFVVFM